MTQSVIKYVDGDVLKHKSTRNTLIVHIVNDEGKWGSGFVVPLGRKYPDVEKSYRDWYTECYSDDIKNHYDEEDLSTESVPFTLGQIQANKVTENLFVINAVAQSQPGGVSINIAEESVYIRPIRLECLRECLLRVAALAKILDAEIVGPAFGSERAGGKWSEEIVPLIEECICKYDIPVTIYLLK